MNSHDFSAPDTTFYELIVADVQQVAIETLGRELNVKEVTTLYHKFEMDWYEAIESYLPYVTS